MLRGGGGEVVNNSFFLGGGNERFEHLNLSAGGTGLFREDPFLKDQGHFRFERRERKRISPADENGEQKDIVSKFSTNLLQEIPEYFSSNLGGRCHREGLFIEKRRVYKKIRIQI